MIQRIQSIFMLLVILLGLAFFFIPILELVEGETYVMNAYHTSLKTGEGVILIGNMGVGVLEGVIVLIVLVSLFMYKKRQLQVKLGKFTILLIALQIAAIVLYSDAAKETLAVDAKEVSVAFKLGAVIPVLSLIFTFLAIRFIKKDDELVRAADRLR